MSAGERHSGGPAAARSGAPGPPDDTVKQLVPRGPEMGMSQSRRSASTPPPWARQWRLRRKMVCRPGVRRGCAKSWDRHWKTFRLCLRGDPPARVEPLRATFKPGAKVVKAPGRAYSPIKTTWVTTCIGTLVALGLMFRDLQAV